MPIYVKVRCVSVIMSYITVHFALQLTILMVVYLQKVTMHDIQMCEACYLEHKNTFHLCKRTWVYILIKLILDLHLHKRMTNEIEKYCKAFCSICTAPFHSSVPRARVRAEGSKVKSERRAVSNYISRRGLSLYCSLATSRAEGTDLYQRG